MIHRISWTALQQARLRQALDDGEVVAYVVTDQWGRPSNGGRGTVCHSGACHSVPGPLSICSRGLHGTTEPHRWRGSRVWIAVFVAPVEWQDDKVASLQREIIGEILPGDMVDASVVVRCGVHLGSLQGAYLPLADLRGANLTDADLWRADLQDAKLRGADLRGAYLWRANLIGADLRNADLRNADLQDANLPGAKLQGADLRGAKLQDADLRGGKIQDADLRGASLIGAL